MSPPHAREAACTYLRRGWGVIPVPLGQKRPVRKGWPQLRLSEAELANTFATPSNVGVLLGTPSGGLVDIDLDAPEALVLADAFLPPTGARFGRIGTPGAHLLYVVTDAVTTTQFRDPLATQADGRGMLVELRATGCQTLVPPSLHPNGEVIVWEEDRDPPHLSAAELTPAVRRLAAASLLARLWSAPGSRHNAALALAGGLLRAGWAEDDVTHFVGAVTHAADDEETDDRINAVATTAVALRTNRHTTGWPTLVALFDSRVLDRVRDWLGIDGALAIVSAAPDTDNGELAPPVPFPVAVLPPVLATFVEEGAEAFGIPADYIALPLLGFAAGLIGHQRAIQLKRGWVEHPILWLSIIGRPGSGKSPGMDFARLLLDPLQQAAWIRYQETLGAKEAATAAGQLKVGVEQPRLESFYTTDATFEALAAMLAAAPGLSLIRDELVGWVQAHDAYRRGGDRQTWLLLWSGQRSRSIARVRHPCSSPIPVSASSAASNPIASATCMGRRPATTASSTASSWPGRVATRPLDRGRGRAGDDCGGAAARRPRARRCAGEDPSTGRDPVRGGGPRALRRLA